MTEIQLVPLETSDREQFIRDNQEAFNYGALEEFGQRDDHFEEDGEIISHETISRSIDEGTAFRIMQDNKPVGGVVIRTEYDHGELELLFVSPDVHSKGIGYAAWCEIETMHPEITVWETVTPYFEKRNIHFYVNRCGFHIIAYYNEHFSAPNDKDGEMFDMFAFQKILPKTPQSVKANIYRITHFEYIMIEGREVNSEYLLETKTIDYGNPMIQEKVSELRSDTKTMIEYIQKAYEFVRDNILHSWDIQSPIVSRKASEVLENKTGICWTKSCLLAALLRANGIPAGISYQLLTRADDDDSEGYIIHALNTVYIEEQSKWIRLDARGNKTNVHAEFSIEEEQLAFPVRSQYGEVDYRDNNPDLDERLVSILNNSENILEITTDFTMD